MHHLFEPETETSLTAGTKYQRQAAHGTADHCTKKGKVAEADGANTMGARHSTVALHLRSPQARPRGQGTQILPDVRELRLTAETTGTTTTPTVRVYQLKNVRPKKISGQSYRLDTLDIKPNRQRALALISAKPALKLLPPNCETAPLHAKRNKAQSVNSQGKVRKPSAYTKHKLRFQSSTKQGSKNQDPDEEVDVPTPSNQDNESRWQRLKT